ncbi:MAG: hypothetical protein ACYDHA_05805 [Bellilinea sp.]
MSVLSGVIRRDGVRKIGGVPVFAINYTSLQPFPTDGFDGLNYQVFAP